jgi:hypothetical protein
MIQDSDPGDENDHPLASEALEAKAEALEAKAEALVALIGTVGTVSQKTLADMMAHQRQVHQERLREAA